MQAIAVRAARGGVRYFNQYQEAVISRSDSTLLCAVAKAEQAALEKFELVIQNNQLAQDHLNLLSNQKNEIAAAIKKMKFLQQKYAD